MFANYQWDPAAYMIPNNFRIDVYIYKEAATFSLHTLGKKP